MAESVLAGGAANAGAAAEGSGAAAGAAAGGGGANGAAAGGAGASWRDSLPEEIRGNIAISQFKDVASLTQAHINAQALIGKKGVIVPDAAATEQDWSHFYKSIGQPELEKYNLQMPEGAQIPAERLTKFKEVAHKLGLLPKQAEALMKWSAESSNADSTALQAKQSENHKAEIAALQKEWGAGFDKQVALARLAVKEGGPEFEKYLAESPIGNDPKLIRFMASIAAKYLGEDKLRGEGGGHFGSTPAEALRDHEAIQSKIWATSPNDPSYPMLSRQLQEAAKKRFGN